MKRSRKSAAAAAAKTAEIPIIEEAQAPTPEPDADAEADADAGAASYMILQLPINHQKIDELLHQDSMTTTGIEYNPKITIPEPYIPDNPYISGPERMDDPVEESISGLAASAPAAAVPADECAGAAAAPDKLPTTSAAISTKKPRICFWCVHDIGHLCFGMPTRYDILTKTFTTYGNFCSLECAAAHNFSVHLGSDRAWEIHSWIQMLGKRFGYPNPIRPAPSRYLLDLFEGPLSIEEFRAAHQNPSRTVILNIPPMISTPSQMEVVNTSWIQNGGTNTVGAMEIGLPKKIPGRSKPAVNPKTLDAKMNLIIESVGAA